MISQDVSEARVPAPLGYIRMVFERSLVFPKGILQRRHCHELHYYNLMPILCYASSL